MLILDLALKSLRNRAFSTWLTVSSIALSVALLIGVENVRGGMRESFSNTISQTDLIVGVKGGTIQLLLYSVFGLGSPTSNLSWESYREWAEHPAVDWTIPYSLGDSHRGYRVIGTNEDFYRHYRYRGGQEIELAEGEALSELLDVTLGADVANELNYGLGDRIAITHGIGEVGFITHDHMPFTVTGILEKTFTPVDRAIYVTLEGMEAIHLEEGEDGHDHDHGEAAADGGDHAHEEEEDNAHDHAEEDGHDHDDAHDEDAHSEDDHDHEDSHDHDDEGRDHDDDLAHDDEDAEHDAATDHDHADEDAGHDHDEDAHDEDAHSEDEDEHADEDGHDHADDDAHADDATGQDGHDHAEGLTRENVAVTQITSFFVGTTDRRDVLRLQREINDYEEAPMMAVIPGVALNEMWEGIGYAETGLRVVTIFVVLVGLLGMLVSLYTSLNERRREMAILRAVGAGPRRIVALLVIESVCLAAAGALAGLVLVYGLLTAGQPILEAQTGLFLPIRPPGSLEWTFLGAVVAAGFLMGFVPALKAYRTALHDGLAVRA